MKESVKKVETGVQVVPNVEQATQAVQTVEQGASLAKTNLNAFKHVQMDGFKSYGEFKKRFEGTGLRA